ETRSSPGWTRARSRHESIDRSVGRARLQLEADRSAAMGWMRARPLAEPGELRTGAVRFEQHEVVRVTTGPEAQVRAELGRQAPGIAPGRRPDGIGAVAEQRSRGRRPSQSSSQGRAAPGGTRIA